MGNISNAVRAVIGNVGKTQSELGIYLGCSSKQVMNNKMRMNRWSANELAKVAEFAGGRLAIISDNGSITYIDPENEKPEE